MSETDTHKAQPGSTVTLVKKAELAQSNANENDWDSGFTTLVKNHSHQVLTPPYDPERLQRICFENNTLAQCIEAMEVNIDGTGFQINSPGNAEEYDEDPEIARITNFFKEPYPRTSFVSVRRAIRRDLESVGYGFMEVIRTPQGAIAMVRHLPVASMRLLKLGEPIKTTLRMAGNREVTTALPYRLFVQDPGSGRPVYFKQFGCPVDVSVSTGEVQPAGRQLPAKDRASEVIMFGVHPAPKSPYFVPRWLNQMPSVLGSRQAEETNLDFFEAGGIPAAIVFVGGGAMTTTSRDNLNDVLSGKARSQTRAAIVEVHSTSGDMNSSGKVDIKVERFGSEQAKDSLYENYDKRCEERARGAFRLPPLFVGKASDYSFATAYASYVIAESQVFKPERVEFDEIINVTLMREMAPEGYTFDSLPLSVTNVEAQLAAADKALDKNLISGQGYIRAVNALTGSDLEYDEDAETLAREERTLEAKARADALAAGTAAKQPAEGSNPVPNPKATPDGPTPTSVAKADISELAGLAHDYLTLMGMAEGKLSKTASEALLARIGTLNPEQSQTFSRMVGGAIFGENAVDLDGCSELVTVAGSLIAHG
jgi:PBSX family phage portal protein